MTNLVLLYLRRLPAGDFFFSPACGTIRIGNPDPDSTLGGKGSEGGMGMEEIMRFVGGMIKQTEEDLAFQRKSDPDDEWLKFLEGKLQAFRLVWGYLEDLQRRREQLH